MLTGGQQSGGLRWTHAPPSAPLPSPAPATPPGPSVLGAVCAQGCGGLWKRTRMDSPPRRLDRRICPAPDPGGGSGKREGPWQRPRTRLLSGVKSQPRCHHPGFHPGSPGPAPPRFTPSTLGAPSPRAGGHRGQVWPGPGTAGGGFICTSRRRPGTNRHVSLPCPWAQLTQSAERQPPGRRACGRAAGVGDPCSGPASPPEPQA